MMRARFLWAAAAVVAIFGVVAAPASAVSQRPVCPGPVAAGQALCSSRVVTDGKGTPQATTAPKGYGPAQFRGAYGLPSSAATSQTIAITSPICGR